jgi:tetratricopeptide (TPR) repeat protein
MVIGKPKTAEDYIQWAELHLRNENFGRAAKDCSKAIKLDPANASAFRLRGFVYEKQGNYGGAISDYTQAIALDPNNALAYSGRGKAHGKNGDHESASSDFTKAISLDPDLVEAYVGRGYAFLNKVGFDSAIADFNHAIELDSHCTAAYLARGKAYRSIGDTAKAESDFLIVKVHIISEKMADASSEEEMTGLGDLFRKTVGCDVENLPPDEIMDYVLYSGMGYHYRIRTGRNIYTGVCD